MAEVAVQSLAHKMALVARDCGHVPKSGYNEHFKYRFASANDVLSKVNESLAEYKVFATVDVEHVSENFGQTSSGAPGHRVTVKLSLTLHDGDSDAILSTSAFGTGIDSGDKAVAKAQTMGLKYAWMLALNISTGDDPEADTQTNRRTAAPRAQAAQRPAAQRADADLTAPLDADGRAKFYAYVQQNGWSQAQIDGLALKNYGAGAPSRLTVGQARALAAVAKVEKPPAGTPVVPGEDSDEDNGQVSSDPDDAFDQLGDQFEHESALAGAREVAAALREARISHKPPAPGWTAAELRAWTDENQRKVPVGASRG